MYTLLCRAEVSKITHAHKFWNLNIVLCNLNFALKVVNLFQVLTIKKPENTFRNFVESFKILFTFAIDNIKLQQ